MIAFFITLWISVMSMFGINTMTIDTELSADTKQPPAGTPSQSAPQNTVNACLQKKDGEGCSFQLNNNNHEGICLPSGATLACTPVLPK